jgi:hypothetical protein
MTGVLVWAIAIGVVIGCNSQHANEQRVADTVPRRSDTVATGSGRDLDQTLVRRADSLAALDPQRELEAALARGDRRFIAICGYACNPPGLTNRQLSSIRPEQLNKIDGTSDNLTPGVARLNTAAYDYALKYNTLLLARIRK